MTKIKLQSYLRESVHQRLAAEAERREQSISATVDQWLYETLPQASTPTAEPAEAEPAPCPYLTHMDAVGEVWDAVGAQREGLTFAQFTKKYGRHRDTGALL